MTRRDFELIARVLRNHAECMSMDHPEQSRMAGLRLEFNEELKQTSMYYDESKFLTAAKPRPEAYNNVIRKLRGEPVLPIEGV
jgi:hypothetical protein